MGIFFALWYAGIMTTSSVKGERGRSDECDRTAVSTLVTLMSSYVVFVNFLDGPKYFSKEER